MLLSNYPPGVIKEVISSFVLILAVSIILLVRCQVLWILFSLILKKISIEFSDAVYDYVDSWFDYGENYKRNKE